VFFKNYMSLLLENDNGCFFPNSLQDVEIKLNSLGEDYVESRIFGYNPNKYSSKDLTETITIGKFSGSLSNLYKISFDEFSKTYSSPIVDAKDAYYILTGINHKENKEKKVFISYSWDDELHKEWVKNLAYEMSEHFIVEFDANLKIGMSPLNYMKQNILSSDYVIIVFTPEYLKKTKNENISGVKYEFSVVLEDLFRRIPTGKFIPLLRKGNKEISIPEKMQDAIYIDFLKEVEYSEKLKQLIERISDQNI
jgi:hypothetical protein